MRTRDNNSPTDLSEPALSPAFPHGTKNVVDVTHLVRKAPPDGEVVKKAAYATALR